MSDYMSDDSDQYHDDFEEDDEDMGSEPDSSVEIEDDESDEGGYNYGMDMSTTISKPKKKPYDVEYEPLSTQDLERSMAKEAEHIAAMFGVEMTTAYMLLRYMQWNKEKLIDRFMDDPDAVREKAGIPDTLSASRSDPSSSSKRSTRKSKATAPDFMCPICCDEHTETFSLSCNHTFCRDCWGTYLSGKIRDEGEYAIRCMESGCNTLVPDDIILGDIPPLLDSETKQKFHNLLIRNFVETQSALRFCPAPNCTYAVQCQSAAVKSSLETVVPSVKCGLDHPFCFGCGEEGDHRPLICVIAKLWLKKCQDDSETANWIKSNTKECPKCNSTIEKNGGCNHMTCKKCKNEFCWVCMGPWSEHGNAWYSCNRYEEREGIEARDAQAKSRASLEKYLHYYNRWANHEQSARLSVDLYAKTEKKMEEMQVTSDLTWIEVQFAKKAVDEVVKCRMTLKWTYAMGYYLEKSNYKEMFEDNQRDLENAVEALCELLERPIEPENIANLRQQVTDKTVYVLKRNEVMLNDTAQGFLEGRWTWNTDVSPFRK